MDNVIVRLIELPSRIHAFIVRNGEEDFYIIVINSMLSEDKQHEALFHELDHLRHNDFLCEYSVNVLERIKHWENKDQ